MNGITELFDVMGGGIGAVVILSALVACIVACALVVIDTARETIGDIRYYMYKKRKDRKTKN